MSSDVILIGVGEMGGVFARGLLRIGLSVIPVTRTMSPDDMASRHPDPRMVVVAVGESDLDNVLTGMPAVWRDRLVLLQNELLPASWQAHSLEKPTVISVWFEKKPGREFKVIIPSPAAGPHASLLRDALGSLSIPVVVLPEEQPDQLLEQLVIKNLYILTTNIAGLEVGGTVESLWRDHRQLAGEVAAEVLQLQSALTGSSFDRQRMIDGMVAAFEGDPVHQCTGRSAPARLSRALGQAATHGLELPRLRLIAANRG
jgi:hypothetical protein